MQLRSLYHYCVAALSALVAGYPARRMVVIGVTGTKGKSTVVELVSALLRAAGHRVAQSSTVHFVINDHDEPNRMRMSMPGRGFLQFFLRRARRAGCTHAVLEMTSEGARQHRHLFLAPDMLIVTHISPEHIESHGSYEKYVRAKLLIAEALARSPKNKRTLITNAHDAETPRFKKIANVTHVSFSSQDPFPYSTTLLGEFNRENILAAVAAARALGVSEATIQKAVREFKGVRGRMENVAEGYPIDCYIDYAHTADSLTKAYESLGTQKKICVLGGTGGGRDRAKRAVMGTVAAQHCAHTILTTEDPYDEDPRAIAEEVGSGMGSALYEIVLDRRAAIRRALTLATPGDAVIISGKGSDQSIAGPRGTALPWDDATVAREELEKHYGPRK